MVYLDDSIGLIYRWLEELGQLDNTMVVFTTDHAAIAKGQIYEHGVRVPFIVRYPGFSLPAGSIYEGLIQTLDLAPSIFEMVGLNPASFLFDGESFVGKLNGGDDTRTHLVAELVLDRAVIEQRWKVVRASIFSSSFVTH
jgi:arylsulfatase A-like enzyme